MCNFQIMKYNEKNGLLRIVFLYFIDNVTKHNEKYKC